MSIAKRIGDRWFGRRSGQTILMDIPRLPAFAVSNKIGAKKPGVGRKKGEPKPFIVGESVVGGEEVAM